MSFEVNRGEQQDGVRLVVIKGQLDAHSYHLLKDELKSLLDEGDTRIVLDCSELEYISSAGLGTLKQMRKELAGKDGDLRLARVPAKISNILNLLGFSKIMQIYESNEDAVGSYGAAT